MHVGAWRSLCASPLPAKVIGGRRIPSKIVRTFYASRPSHLSISPPSDSSDSPSETRANAAERPGDVGSTPTLTPITEAKEGQAPVESKQNTTEKNGSYGSAAKRAKRHNKPDGMPPVHIPEWFMSRNVLLGEHSADLTQGVLEVTEKDGKIHTLDELGLNGNDAKLRHPATEAQKVSNVKQLQQPVYRLKMALMSEIMASASAGLSLSRQEVSESFSAGKSHLKLHCLVDGGIYFLDKIVEQLAHTLGADLVRLDAQDLAQIGGDYIRESPDASFNSIWSLGYDSQQLLGRANAREMEEESDVDEDDAEAIEEVEDPAESSRKPPNMFGASFPSFTATAIPIRFGGLQDLTSMAQKAIASLNRGDPPGNNGAHGQTGLSRHRMGAPRSQYQDQKLGNLLEALIDASHMKRLGSSAISTSVPNNSMNNGITHEPSTQKKEPAVSARKSIILIRDYKEINATHQGGQMLEKLIDIVQNRRKQGHKIILIGTTSSADLTPEISRAAIDALQGEGRDSIFRTVVVTPDGAGPTGGFYYMEERRRVREINVRNLQDLIRRLEPIASGLDSQPGWPGILDLPFGPEQTALASRLEEQVLSFDEIHRIVLTAIGNKSQVERETGNEVVLGPLHIVSAMGLLDESDNVKADWASNERRLQRPPLAEQAKAKASPNDLRLKRLRKTCTHHEKQLLRGVINPENIHTTFDHVHAPQETIEALKTLTTLSLVRPDAFKYGVLATDKISGLLLYGPPGTGKTLLAKAVAKESGATVLEVSGSEVYDMYVGESEKNVRAIFSLAAKLSPCVVFIDEADAIFGSRGAGVQRSAHRELVNQFLREWDGMNALSAFIMVATNRPFDLDDAVLRRLPRRLLVDLPSEADRAAILGIHLKDECLDASVSITELAADTPLYSGSDLKNLAVAAALACVREERAEAAAAATQARQDGEEEGVSAAYVYPEMRTLHKRHFDKAMEEISASVNEDMSSLGAIRKFDERYGDRRGRRKKQGYGFTTGVGGMKEKESARVRT